MRTSPQKSPPGFASRGWIEPLESRIAPASVALPVGSGPYTLELDPVDSHIHIIGGAGLEIFDDGAGPGNDLTVTGGGVGDSFSIVSSVRGNVSFTGTLSVDFAGSITVGGPVGTGKDFILKSGAAITDSAVINLGASAAHFTAATSISLTNNASLTTDTGSIVLAANQANAAVGPFVGISLDHASIKTTGSGSIQLTGIGGTTGSADYGIALKNGAQITSASAAVNAGTIQLTGKGGTGLNTDHGVYLFGANTLISAVSGLITLDGTGVGTGDSNDGIVLDTGAQITSTGTGPFAAKINLTGTGGDGVNTNHGIFLDGSAIAPKISSIDGNVVLFGSGGLAATGNGSRGISLEHGAQISGGGSASFSFTGNAGAGKNTREGVLITDPGTLVSARDGEVHIVGVGGTGGAGLSGNNGLLVGPGGKVTTVGKGDVNLLGSEGSGSGSEGISVTGQNAAITASGGGHIQLTANNIALDPANASINSGTNSTSLQTGSVTASIDLGGPDVPGTTLGITNAELARITAGTVQIGNGLNAGLNVSASVNYGGNLSLQSGGPITDPGASVAVTGTLDAAAIGGIALTLSGGSITAVSTGVGDVKLAGLNPVSIQSLGVVNGRVNLSGGTFSLAKTNAIASGTGLILNGTLDLNGFLQTLGDLSGAGIITATSAALSTLAVGLGDPSATFNGTIQGHLALEKIGAGTQILAGPDNALDGTKVSFGTLEFDATGAALNAPITLAGGALVINLPGASNTLSASINVAVDSRIGVPAGKTVALAGTIAGPGGLTKTDTGTLILGNQLNSFGPSKVKILGGVLQVATDGALGDAGNDVEINGATFAATGSFVSARDFTNTGGVATIDAQVPNLTLINKAILRPTLTATNANLQYVLTYADTTPVPADIITVGTTAVSLGGGGTLTIHKTSPTATTIDTIEITGGTSATNLVINSTNPNVVTTVDHIIIDNPTSAIGSITLGKNVRLGDGVADSVPDLLVEGLVSKIQLYDINPYALIRLGEALPYTAANKKDTYHNKPNLTIHKVLGPGVIVDLTPSDLPLDANNHYVGGGGLGKVVVDEWDHAPGDAPGGIRTTQSMTSFKLLHGDCYVVFGIDKNHVGSNTIANVGAMIIQNGLWGSSGSEIEGDVHLFDCDGFLAGATLTAASMGLTTIGAGDFAGVLTLTDPDSAGIPTFTVNSDFTGTVVSAGPLKKLKVNGDFTGSLQASYIGSINAYSFTGAGGPGSAIVATDGALGTLTTSAGAVSNFTIVTDQAFKGFNVKLSKLTTDTAGIDNVHIQALSIGNISVSLAAAATGAAGIDLVGIRNSDFVTTGTGTTKSTLGGIGNVTVTLTGVTGGATATGIEDSTFDALVAVNEFGNPNASTANPLGKIAVKITGQDGDSVGIDGADFSANTIGAIAVSVSKGKAGGATAHAIEATDLAATGAIGALSIDGDATTAQVHDLQISAGASVGAISVKSKTAQFGTIDASAILAGQSLDLSSSTPAVLLSALARATLGTVTTTGSITGTKLVAGSNIGAVTTGGGLTDSLLLAGARLGGDFAINGDETYQRAASIAAVTVKGAFARTSIVAGVSPGDYLFGDVGDTTAAAAGTLTNTSSIGPITLSGGMSGAATGTHNYAIEAAAVGKLKLGNNAAVSITSPLYLDPTAITEDPNDVIVRLI